jgi:hypothetical protein
MGLRLREQAKLDKLKPAPTAEPAPICMYMYVYLYVYLVIMPGVESRLSWTS